MPELATQRCVNDTHITLRLVAHAPEIARTFVRHRLRSLGAHEEVADNGCLITSELVTNVVRHVPWARTFRLSVSNNAPTPRIEVWDPSTARPVINENPEGESGRGLLIVAALATTWYYSIVPPEHGGGKIVAALL